MPELTIDLTQLGIDVDDAAGWVEAVDALGNPMPVVASGASLVFGSRALDFDSEGQASIDLPSTSTLTPPGVRYRVFLTRTDTVTSPFAVGPFLLTADASLHDVAILPPADVVAAFQAVIDASQELLEALEPIDGLADRIDGVNDHGDVSGTLLLNPAKGFHIFDATGATTVELGTPPGNSLSFKAITGADQVEVNGLPDLELTDNAWATFVYYRGAWDLAAAGAGGGGSVEPVTDPPTQPGAVTVDPTADGFNLSAIASTTAAGYEWQIDGGSYVDGGPNPTHSHTGLAPGSSHSGAVRAYNSLGAKSTARAWGPASTDTVGLHEQLLALDPLFYYRMSRGSKESFGSSTSAYNSFQYGTPNYTGPVLMAGEEGSLYLSDTGGPWLGNPDARPDLNGMTQITVVALVAAHGSAAVVQASGLFKASFSAASTGSYVNEYARHGQTHLFGMTGAADGTKGQWRDGVKVDVDSQVWTPGGTLAADSELAGYSRIGGTPFGGAGGIDLSHIAIIPGVLTGPQMVALAQAAGTYGNPA